MATHELELVTSDILQEQLCVSRSTLWRLRQQGLPYRQVGRVVRYNLHEVEAWLKDQSIGKLVNAELSSTPSENLKGQEHADNRLVSSYSSTEIEHGPSTPAKSTEPLAPCHWSPSVALDPKHRPQAPNSPASTVRRDWRKYPQEAHLLDSKGHRYRRLLEDEIAILQGFPKEWARETGLTHRERIAGLGNAVPPPLGEALYRAMGSVLKETPKTSMEICAGFGGLALGAHRAGVTSTLALVEIWEAAVRVLRSAGFWDPAVVHLSDLLEFDFSKYTGCVDILSGGPPCQPWSQAGLAKGAADERDLLGMMPGIIEALAPKAFILENVPGLISPRHRDYLEWLVLQLRAAGGYGVAVGLVQAADFGVPQKRKRIIIAGIRDQDDASAHSFFDNLAGLRTHADRSKSLPDGRRPWRTFEEAIPDWSQVNGWRQWLDAPKESSKLEERDEPQVDRLAGSQKMKSTLSTPFLGLAWPGRDYAVEWSGSNWSVSKKIDGNSISAHPLLRSDSVGRAVVDPWYLNGDQIKSLEALRPALGRSARLVYFEPPRLDTDLVSFASEDSRSRLNTWLTLNQATIRRAISMVRDDGVLVILTGAAEQPYLQVMLDEAFGPENRVGTVAWQKGYSVQGQKKDKPKKEIYSTHDNLLIYSRRREQCLPGAALKGPPKNFQNADGDPRGLWKAEQKGANYRRESSDFSVNLPPYRWEVVGGDLPPWFWRISPKSGVIWADASEVCEAGSWTIRIRATDSKGASVEQDFEIEVKETGVAPEPVCPSWLIARDEEGNLTNSDSPANAPKARGPLKLISKSRFTGVVGHSFYACIEATGGCPFTGTTRPGKSSESGKSRYWDLSYRSLERAAAEDAIDFKSRDDSIPAIKVYLDGASYTFINQISTWRGEGKGKVSGSRNDPSRVGWGQDAKKELEELVRLNFVERVINIGKPAGLMSRLLGLFTDDDDWVVDIGSPTAEMASIATQLRRRSVYVEMPGTPEDAMTIRLPRLRAAARGQHPLPEGVLFTSSTDEPDPHGFYVGRKPRDKDLQADVCSFKVGDPLVDIDPQTKVPRLDYTSYPSGSECFLQALASVEGLVWHSSQGSEFALSQDGRIIALHIDGKSVLDGRTLENIEQLYEDHLKQPNHMIRVYFHRGYGEESSHGRRIELRHIPFALSLSGGGWT